MTGRLETGNTGKTCCPRPGQASDGRGLRKTVCQEAEGGALGRCVCVEETWYLSVC